MATSQQSTPHYITVKHWLPPVIAVIALYVILPQLGIFGSALRAARQAHVGLLALATMATGLTFVFGAGVYKTLAFKPLSYRRTLIAQLAANFFNRVLPAGVGGIGANYRYLRQQKHTAVQASTVVAANNSLGFVGHMSLLVTLLLLFHHHSAPMRVAPKAAVAVTIAVLAIIMTVAFVPRVRRKFQEGLQSFAGQLLKYRQHPDRLVLALALQLCLTLANVTAFWLCAHALHLDVPFVAALLIFTFGFGLGTAVPTPGGLGGVEAGLVAGLVAYHQTAATALGAVLTYRLLSYWLPLLVSAPVCIYATRRHYFD